MSKKESTKISLKQVGQNVIVMFGEEKTSRKLEDKAERENLKSLVMSYEKKPTLKAEKEIRKIMEAKKLEEKTKAEVITKSSSKVVKEKVSKAKTKPVSNTEKKKAEEAKKEEVKVAPAPRVTRRGEY